MANDKLTIQEWVDKADYEGGLFDGFEYGLGVADLAESEPHEVYDAVLAAQDAFVGFQHAEKHLEKVLSDLGVEREAF